MIEFFFSKNLPIGKETPSRIIKLALVFICLFCMLPGLVTTESMNKISIGMKSNFELVITFIYSLADNILLREDGREIVLADFGVARRKTTKVSGLVGTPTHFSPEKAESSGHDYKSDLWAAFCVLLHILSGDPPWVKRYPNAVALQFLVRYGWFIVVRI